MIQLPTINSYEIKNARSGELIPVVNGVHLHSVYNPQKEAIALIDAHLDNCKKKNEVVVLGLAFAYHIHYLIEKLTELHGDNFKIIIIEPNSVVHNACVSNSLMPTKNILVYSGKSTSELYSDQNLVHFLLRKPAIIAHGPSFNLYQDYYKAFLTYTAPTSNHEISKFTKNEEIKAYLKQFNPDSSLEEILVNEISSKKNLSEMDMVAMALWEMTKGSQEVESGDNR